MINPLITMPTIPPIGNEDKILVFFIVVNNSVVVVNITVVFVVVDGRSVAGIVRIVGT